MKRIILLLPTIIFLTNIGFSQKATFDEYLIDSVKLEYTLFNTVFPGVDILLEISEATMPRSHRIRAKFENKKYFMPNQTNIVFDKIKTNSNATDKQIIEAYVQILYWRYKPNGPKVITIKKSINEFQDWYYNCKAIFRINEDNYRLLILFKNGQIERVRIFENEINHGVFSPSLVTNNPKEAEIK